MHKGSLRKNSAFFNFTLKILKFDPSNPFIRLRRNTLQLAAGMNGKVNRAEAHQSEGGLIH
jgi:hypothetical protein